MSKIEKFITAKNIGLQSSLRHMSLTFEIDESVADVYTPHDIVYQVGFQCLMELAGPSGDEAKSHMVAVAAAQLNREVYGEIYEGLRDLYTLLYEEGYRPPDSPVIEKLNHLLEPSS